MKKDLAAKRLIPRRRDRPHSGGHTGHPSAGPDVTRPTLLPSNQHHHHHHHHHERGCDNADADEMRNLLMGNLRITITRNSKINFYYK